MTFPQTRHSLIQRLATAGEERDWRAFLPGALVLPHPSWRNTAWLRRNPWFEAEVVPYLQQRTKEMLNLPAR